MRYSEAIIKTLEDWGRTIRQKRGSLMLQKTTDVSEQLKQINSDIALHIAKIRDNCNIEAQLKRENKALRNTVALLKAKRRDLIFSSLGER